ncbi:MAG: hypothetical protein LKF30_05775 [Sphingobium sp.]|jgi:hypothetical protein|nr:hypothetical protein [Sphingobium sp.]MCI1271304.1 hypothetical protein [Sphingobium sp.]MCI2053143.1 hypothetical protein [Sphingobium sp.]
MSAIPDPAKSFREPASENATRDRNEAGQFLNGHKKSRGRPKGSRTKLAEDVVTDVLDSWRRDGPVVLARLAALDPGKYADFIAKVLPREVKVEHRMIDSISDEELQFMLDMAERMAAGAIIIEGNAVDVTPKALAAPAPFDSAPTTKAAQEREALRADLGAQGDRLNAVGAVKQALPSIPHPVGRVVEPNNRDVTRRNLAKLDEDSGIDPASLF